MTIVFIQINREDIERERGCIFLITMYTAIMIKHDQQTTEFLVSMWGKVCRYNSLEIIEKS